MRMFELVPVPVITDFLLVLFTKSLSFLRHNVPQAHRCSQE